jgi:acetyl esterase/lipase
MIKAQNDLHWNLCPSVFICGSFLLLVSALRRKSPQEEHPMPRPAALVLFITLLAALLAPVSAFAGEVVFEEGIEFANPAGQHLKLNLARPKDVAQGQRLPAVVCIHGGGFRAGDRAGWNERCRKLAGEGYVAVTVTYRLAPQFQFPAAVEDVKAAVRWVRLNADKYHVDSDRIGAVGDSAGGHLAQYLGVTGDVKRFDGDQNPRPSSRVACVVNFYGPSDLTKSYGKSVDAAEVLPLFLGGDVEHQRRRHILASPLYWVTPTAAPTLLIHGTEDKYVNYEQAQWIYEKLKAAEVEVQLLTLPGAGHGFKGEDAQKAEKAMFEFFDKHLKH